MSQQQDLRTVINNLATEETIEALQARLDAAGLKTDLSAVPAGRVSETFASAISTLLDRPAGDLTIDQIRAITAEVHATSAALEPKVTADAILQGFRKLDDGVIELTLPVGTSIQEAGKILNVAAIEKGMEFPVFYEGDAEFWAKNEAIAILQTKPGRTYQFKILAESLGKSRNEQVRDHGEGAPLGAIAIAEACQALKEGNDTSLFFKNAASGYKVLVHGTAPGVALNSNGDDGVRINHRYGDVPYTDVAFAPSVSARN